VIDKQQKENDTMVYAVCLALFLLIFSWCFSLFTHVEEKTTDHESGISVLNSIKAALNIN